MSNILNQFNEDFHLSEDKCRRTGMPDESALYDTFDHPLRLMKSIELELESFRLGNKVRKKVEKKIKKQKESKDEADSKNGMEYTTANKSSATLNNNTELIKDVPGVTIKSNENYINNFTNPYPSPSFSSSLKRKEIDKLSSHNISDLEFKNSSEGDKEDEFHSSDQSNLIQDDYLSYSIKIKMKKRKDGNNVKPKRILSTGIEKKGELNIIGNEKTIPSGFEKFKVAYEDYINSVSFKLSNSDYFIQHISKVLSTNKCIDSIYEPIIKNIYRDIKKKIKSQISLSSFYSVIIKETVINKGKKGLVILVHTQHNQTFLIKRIKYKEGNIKHISDSFMKVINKFGVNKCISLITSDFSSKIQLFNTIKKALPSLITFILPEDAILNVLNDIFQTRSFFGLFHTIKGFIDVFRDQFDVSHPSFINNMINQYYANRHIKKRLKFQHLNILLYYVNTIYQLIINSTFLDNNDNIKLLESFAGNNYELFLNQISDIHTILNLLDPFINHCNYSYNDIATLYNDYLSIDATLNNIKLNIFSSFELVDILTTRIKLEYFQNISMFYALYPNPQHSPNLLESHFDEGIEFLKQYIKMSYTEENVQDCLSEVEAYRESFKINDLIEDPIINPLQYWNTCGTNDFALLYQIAIKWWSIPVSLSDFNDFDFDFSTYMNNDSNLSHCMLKKLSSIYTNISILYNN